MLRNSTSTLEAIVVPYEVERADTRAARAPVDLIGLGFLDRLQEAGWTVHRSDVWTRLPAGAPKDRIVADVGRATARAVANARSQGRFPLVLSGGCLTAVGVVAGLQRLGRDLGLVWIDAHGDFNTPESTPTGYWDGMSLAAVCGRSLPEVYKPVELRPVHYRNVAHLAGRNFDPPEIEDVRRLSLTVLPPDRLGEPDAQAQIARSISGAKEVYLHVDLDGLDPEDAPAVHFPEPGGPALEDLLHCLAGLPPLAAMTLSGMSFERVDEGQAHRLRDTVLRLVNGILVRSAGGTSPVSSLA
jgi:arginase